MTRTIDEALSRFTLIGGPGAEEKNEACAMTLLAWVAGEKWTDHPKCAHPTLARLAVNSNDGYGVTAADRERIVRAGAAGILDTWWVPTEVIVAEMAKVPKGASDVDRAVAVADGVAAWKATPGAKVRPYLADADLTGADLTGCNLAGCNLARANLAGCDLSSSNLAGCNLARANLAGCDLSSSNLAGCNLAGADLVGSNLAHGCNLARADLTDADLTGTNLAGAIGSQWTVLPAGWEVRDGLVVAR